MRYKLLGNFIRTAILKWKVKDGFYDGFANVASFAKMLCCDYLGDYQAEHACKATMKPLRILKLRLGSLFF